MINLDDSIIDSIWGQLCDKKGLQSRLENLVEGFEKEFGTKPEAIFSTSGRTELAGNHTDHNRGLVIAATVTLDTLACVKYNDDMVVRLISEGFSPSYVDLGQGLEVREEEVGTSMALVRGVARGLKDKGCQLRGFDAYTQSIVPKASGMSSSACIEVLCGTIFNPQEDPLILAQIGQFAENQYYRKPCGLMDQMACAYGGIISIDFADPQKPIVNRVKYDFSSKGYDLVIVNTGGSHADLTQDYAAIPYEMKSVAGYFNKQYLREVDEKLFYSKLKQCREALGDDRAILRAIHYFEENKRVRKMIEALQKDDIQSYLTIMRSSGRSSYEYLQNVYTNKNPKEQGISLGLSLTDGFLGDKGSYRVQGGGFAGTMQALIPLEMTASYIDLMESVFGQSCCLKVAIRQKPTAKIISFN